MILASFTQANMNSEKLTVYISKILKSVENGGDKALVRFSAKFDRAKITVDQLPVDKRELASSEQSLSAPLKNALEAAAKNVKSFHSCELKNIKLSWTEFQHAIEDSQE